MRACIKTVCLWVLVVSAFCAGSSVAWAASGSVYGSPHHLCIASGSLGTTTIHWSTSGCQTAQVYVSMDGGGETLFAQGASGSSNATWIQPEHIYIFSLYEGTAHSNLLAWTSITSNVPPASNLGFNYWPADCTCDILTDAKWTTSMKNEVKEDLDHIASLSGAAVRLMFWSNCSGYVLDGEDQGGTVNSDHTEICDNLPDLLGYCHDRKIKVVIAFGNVYLTSSTGQGERWWQWAYGDTDQGFNEFKADSETWAEGIVDACEGSAYKADVIYYDINNEVSDLHPRCWAYVNHIYDNCDIPKGKKACSPLRISIDTEKLKDGLNGRRLDYIEQHTYPLGNNPYYATNHATLATYFPHTTRTVGEYGQGCEDSTEESSQEQRVLDVSEWAIDNDVPYYQHWMLWDHTPPADNQVYGWGYSHNSPKDVMGGMTDLLNLVANPDMEDNDGGVPQYWYDGGTVDRTFWRATPGGGAATNTAMARIRVTNESSGYVYIYSAKFDVEGGKELYLNAYICTNMTDARMRVWEYDSSDALIATTDGPTYTPAWGNKHYLHEVGSWSLSLNANTRKVRVGALAYCDADATNYLDLDTVSAWER